MANRIIINIRDETPDSVAVNLVLKVIYEGYQSHANNKDHYCWHSCFNNGICVHVKPKYGTDSEIFEVANKSKAHGDSK